MKRSIHDVVTESLSSGRRIRVPVHSPDSCPSLRKVLAEILSRFGCGELLIPLFTCLMELLNNALKANYKSIFFENYTPSEKLDYPTALKLFQLEIGRKEHIIQRLAEERRATADIIFRVLDDTLHISAVNNVQMTADEYRSIAAKFESAKNCCSLTEYFIRNEHDPFREGAGIGLVLVMMILRSLGADSSSLSIHSEHGITAASILVPLNEVTLRAYREKLIDTEREKKAKSL